jgi:hypothetical protein
MKRLLAVLAVLAMALIPVAAQATSSPATWPHLKTDPLVFRVHKVTPGTGESQKSDFLCTTCAVDSATTNRLGTQIAILDTTDAANTESWRTQENQALSDTSGIYCQVTVWDPNSLCASGADSLYCAAQVSADGLNWVTVKTFTGGTASSIASRLDQTNATGAFVGALSLNGASIAYGQPVWKFLYKTRAANGVADVDRGNMQTWTLLRFILGFPDAYKYGVRAAVTHYTVNE